MIYRTLGKTGLKVSRLGFGCMRLPTVSGGQQIDRERAFAMFTRALEGGVNYFDTATMYHDGDSQYALGEFFKGQREKIVLSTKNPCYEKDSSQWEQHLEESLERLQTDYIDIYNHHGINWNSYSDVVAPHLSKKMLRAKEQGMIRHICCSFHDNNEALVKLIESGYPDVITLQYNLLDQSLAPGIELAKKHNIGIVVMGPVGGGRLGSDTSVLKNLLKDIQRVPELALRFVLANNAVTLALSGMSTLQQVEENIAVASDERAFSDDEQNILAEHLARLQKMADLYCSGCAYCMPCPQNVDIPTTFRLFNEGRVYDLWDNARKSYANWTLKKGRGTDQCIQCGACAPKCPQKIDIPAQLEKAGRALT